MLLTLGAPKASFVSALYVALFFPRRRQGASRCALPFAAATAGGLARWQTAELVHCRAAAARPEDLPQALQNTMPVKQPRHVRQHGASSRRVGPEEGLHLQPRAAGATAASSARNAGGAAIIIWQRVRQHGLATEC